MSDIYEFCTEDKKLTTALFKAGWSNYIWLNTGPGGSTAQFNIPMTGIQRFKRFLDNYNRKLHASS